MEEDAEDLTQDSAQLSSGRHQNFKSPNAPAPNAKPYSPPSPTEPVPVAEEQGQGQHGSGLEVMEGEDDGKYNPDSAFGEGAEEGVGEIGIAGSNADEDEDSM